MEILPSEYQNIDLTRFEKLFIRYAISSGDYGYYLLRVNPAMIANEYMNVLIASKGIIFFKFYDTFTDSNIFKNFIDTHINFLYPITQNTLSKKLLGNKLLSEEQSLKFAINIVYVFPNIQKADILNDLSSDTLDFVDNHCAFKDDFNSLRTNFSNIYSFLNRPIVPVSKSSFNIDDLCINAILQRIAPEYVTVRVASIKDTESKPGVKNELLVVDESDVVVKAFRLDNDQINIVNKISKDDPNQLIIACAGSGKSVLLISKCFKAAQMNPDKKFLITCRNENLHSYYTWLIDRAGLRERNVECMTFHTLCKRLLTTNRFNVGNTDFDGWVTSVIDKMNSGKIPNRYYGIFIDEVQAFEPEWYKLCFNLLENKSSKEHIFVICGDKSQRLEKQKKRGIAPWQVGEGYPSYKGGNKNIRIEKNYRNCIEINEYINRYVSNVRNYLYSIQDNYEMDPDKFLRGQAIYNGYGVYFKKLENRTSACEVNEIINAIKDAHDEKEIPYDEIAVIMYQGKHRGYIPGWKDKQYYLEDPLARKLYTEDVPFCRLYNSDAGWSDHFGETGGVRLIKFQSSLGLDFRAAIICGLEPLGHYEKIKNPNWEILKSDDDNYHRALNDTEICIQNLYVACTRAKEALYIISPESKSESVFIKLLEESI